jgi:uncharacterized membrane protein YcaP (DUF421 family)
MSGTSTSSSNGTIIISGPAVIQVQDFFLKAGILHPIIVGSIVVIVLFTYLRTGSNRSVAPITVFDWVINVALGSTLAGIVNGNSLVRGLLALATMLGFQYFTSTISTRFQHFAWLFQGPPLVLAFRGKMLTAVMRKHRISSVDLNAALRQRGILNISQVECAIIEPNGSFSVFTIKEVKDAGVEPAVLMVVPAYEALCNSFAVLTDGQPEGVNEEDLEKGKGEAVFEASRNQNSIVLKTC